jgi:transposase InsO family protein
MAKYRKYSKEFKLQAAKLVTEQRYSYQNAAKRLGTTGWSMSDTIDSALVQSAMKMALADRRPDTGLIHHSDRGVQYASGDFQDLLDDNKVICSMSRKGNCWDNACVESFFAV